MYGFRGTYVGAGSDPVDGCGENEKPDDGNYGCPWSEFEVFIYVLSLQNRVRSTGAEGTWEVSADHDIPPLDCRVMLEVSGVERVSRTASCSERRRTLTYPAQARSVELQVLKSCGTYRVHPWWFRSSVSRGFRKLPPIQTPLLFLQRSSCLTTTETGNGTEGRTIGSKTIIRRGTTVPGEAPEAGMTTTTQRGNEGNTTMGSVSSRTLFHRSV